MSVPTPYRYHRVELPAFPGIELPAAYDAEEQRLWFPIATVCSILELDVRVQRRRAQRDYAEHVDKLTLSTKGGMQELACLEYEALALWLATIGNSSNDSVIQERIKRLRRQVMAAASDIMTGKLQPVPFNERRRTGDSLVKSRLAALERAVFVGEPTEQEGLRIATYRALSAMRCPPWHGQF